MTPAEFIRAEMARPFRWGDTDCAATADRWVRLVTGISPMLLTGRRHSGPQEAQEWLAEPGGMAVAMNRIMRASGFPRAKEPQAGDIGLVFHKGKLCVAIHAGQYWFSRDETGLLGLPLAACWKAWRIECQPF